MGPVWCRTVYVPRTPLLGQLHPPGPFDQLDEGINRLIRTLHLLHEPVEDLVHEHKTPVFGHRPFGMSRSGLDQELRHRLPSGLGSLADLGCLSRRHTKIESFGALLAAA